MNFLEALKSYPSFLLAVYWSFFGACLGSFANVCIYRIPRKISIIRPRSFCPRCGHKIPFYLNIPVLSYFFLRGKCRFCGAKISIRYPLVETAVALLFLAVYLMFGTSCDTLRFSFAFFFLFTVSATDFDRFQVPVRLTAAGVLTGILTSFLPNLFTSPLESFLGTVIAIGSVVLFNDIFTAIFSREGLGDGDASVAGLIGAYAGWKAFFFSLFFGAVFGIIFSVVLFSVVKGKHDSDWRDPQPRWKKMPFVPFMFIGFAVWTFLARFMPGYLPF
ncbi:prepilin peptidase [candidate division WOR-3 bacterium]|nr:prepilin peptidase [candidate division WOR-3 bacterium]